MNVCEQVCGPMHREVANCCRYVPVHCDEFTVGVFLCFASFCKVSVALSVKSFGVHFVNFAHSCILCLIQSFLLQISSHGSLSCRGHGRRNNATAQGADH